MQAYFELNCFCSLFPVCFYPLFPCVYVSQSVGFVVASLLGPLEFHFRTRCYNGRSWSQPWSCQRYLRSSHQANMWVGCCLDFKAGSVSSPKSWLRKPLGKAVLLTQVPCLKWSRLWSNPHHLILDPWRPTGPWFQTNSHFGIVCFFLSMEIAIFLP